MRSTAEKLRRARYAVFAALAAGGAAVAVLSVPAAPLMPSATAASDPCAASEVAKTIGSVATSTGDYLDTHPRTNQALTTITKQQPGPQSLAALKAYFDANPQAGKDMQQLQQPLAALSSRCKLPLTLTQLTPLLQAAQQGGGAAGGLPGGLQTAQSVGAPAAVSPAQSSTASATSQGGGALPSPAIAGLP